MRNKAKYAFFLFAFSLPLFGEPIVLEKTLNTLLDLEPQQDEMQTIERLISTTEELCLRQKEIKELLVNFRKERALFLKNDTSRLHARYMTEAGEKLYQMIKNDQLEPLFPSDFMGELALCHAIIHKKQ